MMFVDVFCAKDSSLAKLFVDANEQELTSILKLTFCVWVCVCVFTQSLCYYQDVTVNFNAGWIFFC